VHFYIASLLDCKFVLTFIKPDPNHLYILLGEFFFWTQPNNVVDKQIIEFQLFFSTCQI
jgi:hypothetical protein